MHYGRRGGGWADQAPGAGLAVLADDRARREAAPPDDQYAATKCRVCGLTYGEHTGRMCEACRLPIEHHHNGDTTPCWEGLARMAAAKRHAGLELGDVDRQALTRVPHPTFLTETGYR
ncbi:MAG: hypothetical protein QM757_14765 [Paludibaculum sp.]